LVIKIDEHDWRFRVEASDKGVGLPIRGYVFVEPQGFYAIVDSNGRIWVEARVLDFYEETPGYFDSPCYSLCMRMVQQHPQSYGLVDKWCKECWKKNNN